MDDNRAGAIRVKISAAPGRAFRLPRHPILNGRLVFSAFATW